jgi:hypothetical protein
MIARLVLAVVVGVVVGLLCILFGGILVSLHVPIAATVGAWLTDWGWVLGFLAFLWYFFAGGNFTIPRP